jgi:hypothetical protein
MAREYSQSGRESNGAGANIDKPVCAVSAGARLDTAGGQASLLLCESLIGGFYGRNEAMVRISGS